MTIGNQWPAPDPARGAALDRTGVRALVGWTGRSSVDVAMFRTRKGTADVPFPQSAGYAVRTGPHWPGDTPSMHSVPYWWQADIEAYRDQRQTLAADRAATSATRPTTRTEHNHA